MVPMETHSFIPHCTKLNILCPLVYNVKCYQFQPYLANLSCEYGKSHTLLTKYVLVTHIDNIFRKCRLSCRARVFYNNQEPLVTGTYSQSGASIQFICPFMRPRKTWGPLLTQDGPEAYKITNCGQYLWPIHFFRERRRAWAGLSRSCKEQEIWLMHIQLRQTQGLKNHLK